MGRSSTSAGNLGLLREVLSNNASRDPGDLPPVFFRTRDHGRRFDRKTVSGEWKYNDAETIGIRSEASIFVPPSYKGLRKTLEFYQDNGTKTDWVMHEYSQVAHIPCHNKPHQPSLFLQEEVVICKVFKKDATDATQETSSSHLSLFNIPRLRRPTQLPRSSIFYKTKNGLLRTAPYDADDVRAIRLCKELHDEVYSLQLESPKGDPIFGCDTDADSDKDVWQHFTKIRTKNPGVVYAVCHHCDKALKARCCSKEHCISQLERHMKSDKCRSSCSNPSTDEDREMLHRLRAELDNLYKQQILDGKPECEEVNANLTQLNPWVLGHNPCYITTSLNRQTNEGRWEETDEESTAIRMEQQQMQGSWRNIDKDISAIQMDHQLLMEAPEYMGLRRTLEFHLNQNGNKVKTGWIMLEYQQVDNIKSPALFLQGDMVIRKVFHYDKHAVASAFSDFNRWLNGDDVSEEYSYKGEGVNTGNTTVSTDYKHGGGDRKRKRSAASKRTSEVWMYFTEIRTADHDVVYAVCHHCDRGYGSARSTNGTRHLWGHKKSCTSKLPGTGNVNNGANAAWEAEIWPLLQLFKNYAETEQQGSAEDGPAC